MLPSAGLEDLRVTGNSAEDEVFYSEDDFDCDEMEECYQLALKTNPHETEQRFQQLMEQKMKARQ